MQKLGRAHVPCSLAQPPPLPAKHVGFTTGASSTSAMPLRRQQRSDRLKQTPSEHAAASIRPPPTAQTPPTLSHQPLSGSPLTQTRPTPLPPPPPPQVTALLRWASPPDDLGMPVVRCDGPLLQLLARSPLEFVHRAVAEEDANSGGGPVTAAVGGAAPP